MDLYLEQEKADSLHLNHDVTMLAQLKEDEEHQSVTAEEKALWNEAAADADEALLLVTALREDFDYEPVEIAAISKSADSVVELGTEIAGVVISWRLNKEAVRQTVNGAEIAVQDGVTSYSYTDEATYKPAGVTTKSWKVYAEDERGATAEKSTAVSFYNGIYYGVSDGNGEPDSSVILALSKKVQNSRTVNFYADAGTGQYLIYALPARLGTPSFKDRDTGFEAGFSKAYTINFTNSKGFTESYDIWLSNHPALGAINVAVT